MGRTRAVTAGLLLAAALAGPLLAGCSSPPACTASACATAEIQRSLIGDEAKDGASITKAACKDAVLDPGAVWTASCTVTESDGAVARGSGNWFTATNRVTFEVTTVITPPGT